MLSDEKFNNMKKTFTFILSVLVIGASLSLTSCSKDDDDSSGSGSTPKTESISFKLNGADFKVGTFVQDYDETSKYVELTANGDDQVTVLSMYLATTRGNNLDVTEPLDVSVNLQISGDLYSGSTGAVTISSIDKTNRTIEGTFSFDVSDGKQTPTTFSITEGKFYATY